MTEAARTPRQSWSGASGATPSIGSAPCAAFTPTTPHSAAGLRTEPPVSVPSATGTMPAATAAADPPDEPPVIRSGARGLRQAGVTIPQASSCVRAVPSTTAPAERHRATTVASRSGRWWPRPGVPSPIATPATSITSLTTTGMPCSGPRS